MKKLILLAALSIAAFMKPASAQVNVSINIGSRPYYEPVYYSHPSYVYVAQPTYRYTTYAPVRTVVVSNHRTRHYRSAPVYRTSYHRSAPRYHAVKHYGKGPKHFGKHGRGKHGRH